MTFRGACSKAQLRWFGREGSSRGEIDVCSPFDTKPQYSTLSNFGEIRGVLLWGMCTTYCILDRISAEGGLSNFASTSWHSYVLDVFVVD